MSFYNTLFSSFIPMIIIKKEYYKEYGNITILQQLQNIDIVEHNNVRKKIYSILHSTSLKRLYH